MYTPPGTAVMSRPYSSISRPPSKANSPGIGDWASPYSVRVMAATARRSLAVSYGLSATGIGYLPTTITQADVASGAIDHAIAVQLPGCYKFVYPANRYDCP